MNILLICVYVCRTGSSYMLLNCTLYTHFDLDRKLVFFHNTLAC